MIVKKIDIPKEFVVQAPSEPGHKNHGLSCILVNNDEVRAKLRETYGRDNLCIKLFTDTVGADAEKVKWGGVSLEDATKVQNIFSFYGLAPRVLDIATIPWMGIAQVCEYADGSGKPDFAKAQEIVAKYRIGAAGDGDHARRAKDYVALDFKWVGDKFVDFGRFYLTDKAWYANKLRAAIQTRPRGPGRSLVGYQDVREMGIPGQRDHAHRLRHMRLDELPIEGGTVLDIGCNNGTMLREAVRRGAKRVIGVDYDRVGLWKQLNNWLGYWSIDFVEASMPDHWEQIRKETGEQSFDVVFCLAILQHMQGAYEPWIKELTKQVLVLEGDVRQPEKHYRRTLEADFPFVELTGFIRDEDERCLFRCWTKEPAKPRACPRPIFARKKWAIEQAQSIYGQVMLYPGEMEWLADLAHEAPNGPGVEIGPLCGSTTAIWSMTRRPNDKNCVIEIAVRPELLYNIERLQLPVQVIEGDSAQLDVAEKAPKSIGFLFIDGNHSYHGVRADMERYLPRMIENGIVIFDDYVAPAAKNYGVERAVNEWARDAEGWELVGKKDRMIAFRRKANAPTKDS